MASSAPWSGISLEPPEAWVEPETYESTLAAKEGAHITHLLWARQMNAESETAFHTTAMRLETSLAVQHQSQWHVDFNPRAQHLTLHWLRVVREGQTIDHLRRDRMRLLQRETQLDHLVIDGRWTLLIVLDDVRVGDKIEAAFSVKTRHPIRPGSCEAYFAVPAQSLVERYHFSMLFNASHRTPNRHASSDASAFREELLPEGFVRWSWSGSQTDLREPETNQSAAFLDHIYIQISDLTDWQPFIREVVKIWDSTSAPLAIDSWPEFLRPTKVEENDISGFVRQIQDDFRYLSVDLETGGWIPAAPQTVLQRRYGDCKDLAWLATAVLRSWGVTARPVLVNSGRQESIAALLPASLLFDHVVLEVEFSGKKRWFDLTLKAQGGDFASMVVGWFGYGLPLDVTGAWTLEKQPGPRSPELFVLRETIHLDTRKGEFSSVEKRLVVDGWHADNLRRARLAQGAEQFSNERLVQAQKRFGKARRSGVLQWRDNRDRNVCEVIETFEVSDIIQVDETGQRAIFDVPPNIAIHLFQIPENKPRRSGWALPFPIEVRHDITVKARSMDAGLRSRLRWSEPEFTATVDEPKAAGEWSKIVCMVVNTAEVSTERLANFRERLEEFLQATTCRIYLPLASSRSSPDENFGKLPPEDEGMKAYVEPPKLDLFPDAASVRRANRTRPIRRTARRRVARSETGDNSAAILFRVVAPIVFIMFFAFMRGCK